MAYFDRHFYDSKFNEERKTSHHDCYLTQTEDLFVFHCDGRDFLSALWRDLQAGTTGARDIQMKFKDDKEMCISSTVLSNMGQCFQVLQDCGLKESQDKVTLPTVTQSTFNRLMLLTLGQKVEIKTREGLLELLEAAEMMKIRSLVDAYLQHLQSKKNSKNCLHTFVVVRRFRPDKVEREVSFVVSHMKRVIETDEWCSLDWEDISILLNTWTTSTRQSLERISFAEVFDAVLRWIETKGADQDTSTRLLGLMDPREVINVLENLPSHSCLVEIPFAMKAVQAWLRQEGDITLLAVGSAESKGDDCTHSYIYCWSEHRQDWYIFSRRPRKFPKDFAVTKTGNTLVISGGMREKTGPSNEVWAAEESGWKELKRLATARSRHGMAAISDNLYFVGGLPGPMKSIEKRRKKYGNFGISEEVGTLQEAVYDCGVAAVNDKLIVVGGCSSKGPRNIIQTFDTVSCVAQVITLPKSPGLQLDLGFTRYVGTLDSLLFLSRSGHLLEVKVEDYAVTLQSQVLLKDFHHQSPFAAVLDSGGVVVCDSRSADCTYSLNGEKKEEMTVVRRLRDDIQVHGVFRFFLPSKRSVLRHFFFE